MASVFSFNKTFGRYKEILFSKLKSIKASPYSVAAGCACGIAISFTPFVGIHLILAAITAFLIRGSVIASAVGTIAGNPWTFAFIWPATLYTGRKMLGMEHFDGTNFMEIFNSLFKACINLDFKSVGAEVWPIFYPMLVGSIPYYIVVWFLSYYFIKKSLLKM